MHRIGIIGCGWIAPFHLAALQKFADRASVAWVADIDSIRADAIASRYSVRAISDYREGLDEVDCVHILLPHHLHCQVTTVCLEAGKHVLLEKPIATSLEDADTMIACAERNARTLMVGYPHRYRNCFQVFKEIVTGGSYGRLFMLDAMMDECLKDYLTGWTRRKETLGGGVFFSSSPHMLDVMLWIGGEVRCASVVGTRGGCNIEGEDTACSILKFESGVIGVTRHTWASPAAPVWYTMEAVCEQARVRLTTSPEGDLVRDGAECAWTTRIEAHGEHDELLLESGEGLDLTAEVEHFFDCVDTGACPQTDGPAARKIIELVLNAYADAERRGGL
ncbi:MAG: Gfo/Idh/MocA family oxidoreductase [Lentisphaeria bacterium]|jgi:predicted dehydrogenase|nr:Gfo/Idh/MocA family oxidoreductase [Lentisphaeria bacterium]MDP7743255.1 Gfo/Idh/MocA family oxidoreductase [Lentisphaeria bacterium]